MSEKGFKILVADDDNISRRLLQKTLERWGYTVTVVKNGEEAWEKFRTDHFSLIITDWMMPVMDGLELVRRVREYPRKDYVYIIMLTAKSLKEDVVVGMEAGADDFLIKPFNQDELRVRLRAGERIVHLERKLSQRNEELEEANRRMRRDLEAAAKIQESLLPSTLPANPHFEVAWHFKPCEELAGDILNVFSLDENNLGVYLLDVSGHGVAAALLAVTLSRLLSPVLDQSSIIKTRLENPPRYAITPPAEVANQLNRRFPMDAETGQYFTIIYGLFNVVDREFRFVSAGHPPIVHLSRINGPRLVQVSGLPIGFMEQWEYSEVQIPFTKDDRFYMYSDGIIEARSPNQKMYGTDRLLQTLNASRHLPLNDSIQQVLKDLQEWTRREILEDDVSILAVEIRQ